MKHKPWSSPLWQHLEEIAIYRQHHNTWQEISSILSSAYQIEISGKAIRDWYARARNPRLHLPLGMENLKGVVTVQAPATETKPDSYEAWEKKQQTQKPKHGFKTH